jgi:hypothetical protein
LSASGNFKDFVVSQIFKLQSLLVGDQVLPTFFRQVLSKMISGAISDMNLCPKATQCGTPKSISRKQRSAVTREAFKFWFASP